MTSGGKGAGSGQDLVHWGHVDAGFGLNTVHNWKQVEHWQLDEELLGVGLRERVSVVIPLAAFQVETVGVAASLRLSSHILPLKIILDHELEGKSVDGDTSGTSIVLHSGSQEGLWEEEA